jgi:hypothetical protein
MQKEPDAVALFSAIPPKGGLNIAPLKLFSRNQVVVAIVRWRTLPHSSVAH